MRLIDASRRLDLQALDFKAPRLGERQGMSPVSLLYIQVIVPDEPFQSESGEHPGSSLVSPICAFGHFPIALLLRNENQLVTVTSFAASSMTADVGWRPLSLNTS